MSARKDEMWSEGVLLLEAGEAHTARSGQRLHPLEEQLIEHVRKHATHQ